MRTAVLITVVLSWMAAGGARAAEERVYVHSRYLMGTPVEIKARGADEAATQAAIDAAYDEIARLERLMSLGRAEGQLARINAEAGKAPVTVTPEVLEVIERAIGASRVTGGAFDITTQSVSSLWGFDGEHPRVPSKREIKEALRHVGYRHVRINEAARTVFLDEPGVRVGLGGIAKGYAMDRAVAKLREHGVRSALVSAGGDMALLGMDGDHPWRVEIKDPGHPERTLGWFYASDTTVHTSGDHERFIMVGKKRYHCILNPKNGYPARGARSVTVVTPDGTLGDALSRGVFVVGPSRGLRLVESLRNVDAVIVDPGGKVVFSRGMAKRIHLTQRKVSQ
jgi:thiamine biosynthesis lipoprotein